MKKFMGAFIVCSGLVIFGTGCSTIGDWCMSATTYTFVTDKAEAYAIQLANKKIDSLENMTDQEKAGLKALADQKIKEAFLILDQLKAKYDQAKAEKIAHQAVIDSQKEQTK